MRVLVWCAVMIGAVGLVAVSALPTTAMLVHAQDAARAAVDLEGMRRRVERLEAHGRGLLRDVDVAHARIDALRWQLDVVVSTCPGRARPPAPLVAPGPRPKVPDL